MKFKNVIFDLDGTLTDPYVGIANSVNYALGKMKMPCADEKTLRSFIGPPLSDSFLSLGLTLSEAKQAIDFYREYYSEKGIFENIPYPGIDTLLQKLCGGGITCLVATSKPENFAVKVLEHFGIYKNFSVVCGPDISQLHSEKSDIIAEALNRLNIKDTQNCLMVGDRIFDVEGAHCRGVRAAGVLWGYGTKEELENAGADFIINNISELERLLIG